jgi:hypothetical protein
MHLCFRNNLICRFQGMKSELAGSHFVYMCDRYASLIAVKVGHIVEKVKKVKLVLCLTN